MWYAGKPRESRVVCCFLSIIILLRKKEKSTTQFCLDWFSRICIEGKEVRSLWEYALKTHNNIIIQLSCYTSAAYTRNLNIMLRVTCNNVVQQHQTVVQQQQQLSSVVLSYYYHREIFAGGRHKKAHRFTGGLGNLQIVGYSVSSIMPFDLRAARILSAVFTSPSNSSCVA